MGRLAEAYGREEMGQLTPIDFPHVAVGRIGVLTGVGDIGQAVCQLDEGSVGRLTDATIVVLARSLSAVAAFVVGEGIDDFCCHVGLTLIHVLAGQTVDVVVGEACVLYAIMIECSKKQGQHVFFTGTDVMSVLEDGIGHQV